MLLLIIQTSKRRNPTLHPAGGFMFFGRCSYDLVFRTCKLCISQGVCEILYDDVSMAWGGFQRDGHSAACVVFRGSAGNLYRPQPQ